MARTYLRIQDDYIVLSNPYLNSDKYRWLEVISTNPKNKLPYLKAVKVNNDGASDGIYADFGAFGKFVENKGKLFWKGEKAYNEHPYEIAIVLGNSFAGNRVLVYGENIGEEFAQVPAYYHEGSGCIINPVPNVEHKLLIEKPSYKIIHNITMAEKKYYLNQHQL